MADGLSHNPSTSQLDQNCPESLILSVSRFFNEAAAAECYGMPKMPNENGRQVSRAAEFSTYLICLQERGLKRVIME